MPEWFRKLAKTHVLEIWHSERTWKCNAYRHGDGAPTGHAEDRNFREVVNAAVVMCEECYEI